LGSQPKPEVIDLLMMMKSRTARMQNLIDGILHYSRMANCVTEKEKINLSELINSVIDLLEVPPHVRIEYPDNLPALYAEKIKLHEIFQNLISNGIKYNNKESGIVKIAFADIETHYEFSV